MVQEVDKQIYFPRLFNEQMAWIGEEVEHIIKYNEAHKIKEGIKKQGKAAYVAELEYSPKAYFIHEGFDENYDTGEWIGIFYSLSKAKEAYEGR